MKHNTTTIETNVLTITTEAPIDQHSAYKINGSTLSIDSAEGIEAPEHTEVHVVGETLTLRYYNTDSARRRGDRYFEGDDGLLFFLRGARRALKRIDYGMSWVTNADVAAAIMARNLYKKVIYRDGVPGADALDRLVYGITSRAKVIKDYWNHIYETTVYEYNPLENYNMVEDTVHGHVLTRSGAISHTGTDTLVKTGKIKDGGKTTQRQFPVNNGGDAKDYAQTEDSRTTEYDYATDTRTLNTSDGDSRVDTNSGTDTMTRSGNIGVTTSQQMIQSEREITLKILEDYVADLADEFFTNYM